MRKSAFFLVASAFGFLLALIVGELTIRAVSTQSQNVLYLATLDKTNPGLVYKNLKQFLDSKPQLQPFAEDMNYRNNSLGFKDREFVKTKTPDHFRIMAIGDSFTYGVVPYPTSVMTVLEKRLKQSCPNRDIELYNFGLPGSGVWDYFQVFNLAHKTYKPDLLLLHLYLGNDGPSAYFTVDDIPDGAHDRQTRSYLVSYIKNSYRLITGVGWSAIDATKKSGGGGGEKCGGCVVDPKVIITDDSPKLSYPLFSEEKWFGEIAANEISRFFITPPENEKRLWTPILASLDELVKTARSANIKIAIALFPSAFQVYPKNVEEFLIRAKSYGRLDGLTPDKIDFDLPSRVFMKFCEENNLYCFDLTQGISDAARSTTKPLYRKRDTHWLIEGNRIAAEIETGFVSGLVCAH